MRSQRTASPRPNRSATAAIIAEYAGRGRECFCGNARSLARQITQLYDRILRPSSIDASQLATLWSVLGCAPIALGALAQQVGADRATVSRNLVVLQRRGLVTVTAGNDRRTRLVQATALGQSLFATALPYWQQAQREALSLVGVGVSETVRHASVALSRRTVSSRAGSAPR